MRGLHLWHPLFLNSCMSGTARYTLDYTRNKMRSEIRRSRISEALLASLNCTSRLWQVIAVDEGHGAVVQYYLQGNNTWVSRDIPYLFSLDNCGKSFDERFNWAWGANEQEIMVRYKEGGGIVTG